MRECSETLAPEMTSRESEQLTLTLKLHNLPGKHLEIGTAAGGTLCTMMRAYPSSTRPPFVVVDTMAYFPNQLRTVRQNLNDHGMDPSSVDFRVMPSSAAYASSLVHNETFSFILIDGAHKIRYVMEDLRWAALLEAGGILCLHDYSSKHPDVTKAVDRFLRNNRHYQVVDHVDSLLLLRKQATTTKIEVRASDRLYAMAWAPVLQMQRSIQKRTGRRT
ncbi:Uncharacterized protein SCG7086_AM_00120 [Chlamydiales bacterium SCGC AG-110-P3]|nr:Uncharacterized protein SCG7086_AM_00120 [Chlamydiales bacterium SCGC AG-110-P3]